MCPCLPHAGAHEMHDADVTKGRCSRIDSPPRSYYADVIWPANTLPGPIRLTATAILLPSISTSLFFSTINPVFAVARRSIAN